MVAKKHFNKSLLTGVVLGCAASCLTAVQSAVAAPGFKAPPLNNQASQSISNRIIVKYRNNTKESSAAKMSTSMLERSSSIAGVEMQHMRRLATGAQLLTVDKTMSKYEIESAIKNLESNPDVEYAEIDRMMYPLAMPSDPDYNKQWHYSESTGGLNLPAAWDITQGEGVVVAVLDTGIIRHRDLAANLLPGYDMISSADISRDNNGRDSDPTDEGDWVQAGGCGQGQPVRDQNSSWHGTHVAGTVAALANNGEDGVGVAYKASIVPVRVLGRCGGFTSDIADGMIWAAGGNVSGVPANPNPAQVLNLSLGGSGSCGNTTQRAIDIALGNGASVVVAAGNSNTNASTANPANCRGVITVASVGRNGGKASYSNFGNNVDVAAPGGDVRTGLENGVYSTLNSGRERPVSDSYAYYQGTSMAAPHVAGAVALMYAVKPTITPAEVESTLKNTARSFPARCSGCGTGIVDATAALAALNGGGSPGGDDNVLVNGEAKTGLSAARGSELEFIMEVPAGATNITFEISGGSGDADIYVRKGSKPTGRAPNGSDCSPYLNGSNESCVLNSGGGTYYIVIDAFRSFSNLRLVGSYD